MGSDAAENFCKQNSHCTQPFGPPAEAFAGLPSGSVRQLFEGVRGALVGRLEAGPAARRRPAKRGAAAGTAAVAAQHTIDMTGFALGNPIDYGGGVADVSFRRRRVASTLAVRSGAELLRVEVTDAFPPSRGSRAYRLARSLGRPNLFSQRWLGIIYCLWFRNRSANQKPETSDCLFTHSLSLNSLFSAFTSLSTSGRARVKICVIVRGRAG